MLRGLIAGGLFVACVAASATTIKHVAGASVIFNGATVVPLPSRQELREKIHKASSACISPPDFVVVVELISANETTSRSLPPTAAAKEFLVSIGVPAATIFEGEIAIEELRLRHVSGSNTGAAPLGAVEVQIVCTARGL